MKRDYQNAKINVLIKAFLIFNKKKYVSSKMISEWINNHDFGINRSNITSQYVTRAIEKNNLKMFKNVDSIIIHNEKKFRIKED